MSLGLHTGKRSGATGRTRDVHRPMSEINVTPFVDVMLVLLVVFMITAPLLTVGVPIDLPKTRAPSLNEQIEPLVVSIDAEGRIFVQETPVEIDTLVERMRAAFLGERPEGGCSSRSRARGALVAYRA